MAMNGLDWETGWVGGWRVERIPGRMLGSRRRC